MNSRTRPLSTTQFQAGLVGNVAMLVGCELQVKAAMPCWQVRSAPQAAVEHTYKRFWLVALQHFGCKYLQPYVR